jgi:general secretion pathway protein H
VKVSARLTHSAPKRNTRMHGSKLAEAASGFSLIELLVVIFIIGLLIGTVSLSVTIGREPEELLAQAAEDLLEFARLAEDRAVLTGEPIGLQLLPPEEEPTWSYRWQRYRGGRWMAAEPPLIHRQLPDSVEISLEVEGELVNFARLEQDEETPPLPDIVFYPGGEVTPFRLTLFDAEAVDEQQVLTSERTGRVEIETETDEAVL